MKEYEVIQLASRLRDIDVPDGMEVVIRLTKEDWDKLLAYVQQFEPVTMWPLRVRENITNLKVHGTEIVYI